MVSWLLVAVTALLVLVVALLVLVLALLLRLVSLWAFVGASETRSRGTRSTSAHKPFSGGTEAVEAAVHGTTKVVRR